MSSDLQTKFARIHLFLLGKYIRLPGHIHVFIKGVDLLASCIVVTPNDSSSARILLEGLPKRACKSYMI